jgi:hypothetical protein
VEFPDGERSNLASVVFLDAENPTDCILVPRLQASGCDLNRVHIITGRTIKTDDGKTVPAGITLEDMGTIERAIDRVPDCRLQVVDPVGSYLGSRTDSHPDNEVRGVLQPLADLAMRKQIAVLLIAHHRKQDSGFADDLVLGSMATWRGCCVMTWLLPGSHGSSPWNPACNAATPGKVIFSAQLMRMAGMPIFTPCGQRISLCWREPTYR